MKSWFLSIKLGSGTVSSAQSRGCETKTGQHKDRTPSPVVPCGHKHSETSVVPCCAGPVNSRTQDPDQRSPTIANEHKSPDGW
jgi:hypothetical protein